MSIEKKMLKQMGRQVAEIIGNGLTDKRIEAQKKALISYLQQERTYFYYIKKYGIPVIAASFLFLIFVYFILINDQNMEFRVGQEKTIGNIGNMIKGDETLPVQLSFEDGSKISLFGDTDGSVLKSTRKEVNFKLFNGKIEAKIRSNKKVKWLIEAGPYKIIDIGTTFYVEWNGNNNSLKVSVLKGTVLIKGPNLGRGKLLKGVASIFIPGINENNQIKSLEKNSEINNNIIADNIIVQNNKLTESEENNNSIKNECINNLNFRSSQNPEKSLWKEFFNEGRYSESVEFAEKDGFNKLINSLDQNDMWLLADACRYARNGQRAQEVLSSIRQRFSNFNRTKIASFLLGRINIELNKNPGTAANWFIIYLQEDPNGPLAEEALGRLIDAYISAGDRPNATKTARSYLLKYNKGIFAPLANSIIKQ